MASVEGLLTTSLIGMLATASAAGMLAPALAQPVPEHSRPGQCFAKMEYPATYRTVTDRVVGAPVISYRDVPAVIQHSTQHVLATPARTDRETIPAQYRTIWRWVEQPGPTRQVMTPPVYRTVTERRLISPAHLAWRAGGVAHGFSGGGGSYGAMHVRPTGEVLCRVLVPARYGWARHTVMVSPGHETTVQGPPRHVRVQNRELVQPEHVVLHNIPATYRDVDSTRVVRPASRERVVSPGAVHLVTHRVIASPAHFGWTQIVCIPGPNAIRRPVSRPLPRQAPAPAYGAPPVVQSYGASTPAPQSSYGEVSAPEPQSHRYRPDEILAPYPPTVPNLVPAPYDVGHPARR